MGVSDSNLQIDSQGEEGSPHAGADEGAWHSHRRGPRRARVGDGGSGAGFKHQSANDHHAVYRDTEPRVILDNKSSYRVSYWVVEEDKNKNKKITIENREQHAERLVGSMRRYLNASNNARGVWSLKQEEDGEDDDEEEEGEKGVYFLTRDHRMEPRGGTQATKVPFPVRCREMRVCSFFQEDGQWHRFQDKEVSIGLFKKVFTVTALDADIAPYAKRRCDAYR